ncbi:glycosyltransferase family A protein [Pseudobutyrivibrio ruminis]|uniref:glycosyltransferase family A protein n=1 Tax=Pseudobutyrivibrio ruminis TaxID=46206 RepID=UPI0006919DA3|nr:glycosyltransferase family A protein [Pseudobutyrivibrio ruminis]
MSNPKVSVIMPAYNAEKFIEKTINSILNQTYTDFELLIIDDCSTDNTMDVVRRIKDNRIRIINNKTNQGIAKSRNIGLANAKGEYIALMDNDDLTVVDRFEKEVCYLENHPEIGAVGGNVITIDSRDNQISDCAKMINNPQYLWLDIVFQCPMANSSTIFRKSTLENKKICFHDNMLGMEDYRFWTEFSAVADIYNFTDVFLKWRCRDGNETTRVRGELADERAKKFAEIQRLGLEKRGVELEEDEYNVFCEAYSEYKDSISYDVHKLFLVMKKIQKQLIEKHPQRREYITIVLRNRFLEAARRKKVNSMDALENIGFGDFSDEEPLVSVIISTYNRADKLPMSVGSVLNQTYKNIEIIISDDCSTDDTGKVAERLCKEHENIKYIKNESNKGPSATRNNGVKNSSGRYVAFHDDDDEWHPDKLAIQMYRMLNDLEIDMTFGQMCRFRKSQFLNIVDEHLDWEKMSKDFGQELLLDNYVGAPTIVIKKDSFEKIGGFSEEISTIEDWEFAIKAAFNLNVDFLDTPLMDVHVSDNSVTHNYMNYIKSICYIIKKYSECANDRNEYFRRTIQHINGNCRNIKDTEIPVVKDYLKKELYPDYIHDELIMDYIIGNSNAINNSNTTTSVSMTNRLQRYKNVAIKLMNPEKTIATWLKDNNYKRVAIYGTGRLGKCLIDRLEGTEISIVALIDRKGGMYKDYPIYKRDDFCGMSINPDAVIITPLYEAEGISAEIKEKKDVICISVEELCE